MKSKQYFSLHHWGNPGNWVFVLALVLGIGLANVNAQTTQSLVADGQNHRIPDIWERDPDSTFTMVLPSNVTNQFIFIRAVGADGGMQSTRIQQGNTTTVMVEKAPSSVPFLK
jgi:hypothetical protein